MKKVYKVQMQKDCIPEVFVSPVISCYKDLVDFSTCDVTYNQGRLPPFKIFYVVTIHVQLPISFDSPCSTSAHESVAKWHRN
jgi:hypothetical protein